MKKIIIVAVILIIIFAGGYYYYSKKNNNGVQYKFDEVVRGSIKTVISATGTLNPVNTVNVGSQISGIISDIFVNYNSKVKLGQVIAKIDSSSYKARLEQANANLASSIASLKTAEENKNKALTILEESRKQFNRSTELYKNNLISEVERDSAEADYKSNLAAYNSSLANIELAKAEIDQAQSSVKSAQIDLSRTIITSPVNGIVIAKSVEKGQTVAASLQAPTLFIIAEDLTQMQVEADISEADIGNVVEGQDVTFRVDAYPEREFSGKVTQIRLSPETIQNVVNYTTVILVENKDLKLLPGMTATIEVLIDSKDDVLKVANAALKFKPKELTAKNGERKNSAMTSELENEAKQQSKDITKTEKKSNKFGKDNSEQNKNALGAGIHSKRVWLLEDNKLKSVRIKTGISDASYTEIVSGELNEGDSVIVGYITTDSAKNNGIRMRMPH